MLQEKLKNKLFTMVKYKRDIRDKLKRSLREKQVCAVPRLLIFTLLSGADAACLATMWCSRTQVAERRAINKRKKQL